MRMLCDVARRVVAFAVVFDIRVEASKGTHDYPIS